MKKLTTDNLIFAAGLCFSLLAVLALPNFYYQKDFAAFWAWGQFWRSGWQEIYLTCTQCNYPILGMFSTAGLVGWLAPLGFERTVFSFRLLLSLVDGLNVLLVFWLLKQFDVPRAAYWAGVTGFIVCAWVGGALWGQVDGVSQFLMLVLLIWLVRGNARGWKSAAHFRLFVILSGVLLASLILFKQLALFSVLPLGLLLTVNLFFQARPPRELAWNLALLAAVLLVCLFSWNLFLKLPAPYGAHLHYILAEGSQHGDLLSRDGFNLWLFIGREMLSSSHLPLFESLPWLTPYGLGLCLYLAYALSLTLVWLFSLRPTFQSGATRLNRENLLMGIFLLALLNLGFNVFLTGTHERYLYHFYPYLLVAWLGLKTTHPHFSETALGFFVLGGSLYGLLILKVLPNLDFPLGLWPNWLVGLFHFGLLAYLTLVFVQFSKARR